MSALASTFSDGPLAVAERAADDRPAAVARRRSMAMDKIGLKEVALHWLRVAERVEQLEPQRKC